MLRAALIVGALGAAGGALTGALLAVGVASFAVGFGGMRDFLGTVAAGALFGGTFGLLLGPAAGFGLLRRVPLGVAILGTGVGTLIGFTLGVPSIVQGFLAPVIPAVAGFTIAAVLLHLRYRRPPANEP